MFDVLVFLFDHYHAPEACPDAGTLARRLSAAGFEDEDIHEALQWLSGLAESGQSTDFPELEDTRGCRIYADAEYQHLGTEAIGFLLFLEQSGVLTARLRELVIERAMALEHSPVGADSLRIIVLMVLWNQSVDIDHLLLDELLQDSGDTDRMH